MIHQSESQDLLGFTLIVIAMLAMTEGRGDPPIVVAGVTVVTLACFNYLAKRLKPR